MQRIRRELGARLRACIDEIEAAIFARVSTLSEQVETDDAEYVAGLRNAIKEAVDYGITSIERGADWIPPPPAVVAVQAQRAARSGVSLDTVLRRYAAGDRVVGEFIVEEADRLPGQVVGQVMKARGPLVDSLMAHAATHYMRELERMTRSPEQRLAELVEGLLADDGVVDVAELDYEFDAWHLAMIVTGEDAEAAFREAAKAMAFPLLIMSRGPRTAWAWIAAAAPLSPRQLDLLFESPSLVGVALAVGDWRRGLDGWRLSHQEAQAGFQVMLRSPQRLVRGTDVLLLAAMLRNDALANSLIRTYLGPLDEYGDIGGDLRETLRAYFGSGSNAATAAAVLGVDRHTVQRRLRKVEELLGRQLLDCQSRLEVALSLEEIGASAGFDEGVPD